MNELEGTGRLEGGIRIAPRKGISTAAPIRRDLLPPRLVVPLAHRPQQRPTILVRPGDHVRRGQVLARPGTLEDVSAHAPSSGRIAMVDTRLVATPALEQIPCAVLELDGEDTGLEPTPPDPAALETREGIARLLADAGLAGLGGAVYPTGAKVRTAHRVPLQAVIVNGAECEPYISCDDMLMREAPEAVAEGAALLAVLTGAPRALIAIEEDKAEAVRSVAAAVAGLDQGERVSVVTVPTVYPSGGERQLIEILTGQEVPSGQYPPAIGYLCQNVGTVAQLARFFRTGEPLVSRIVTLTGGGLAEPGNHELRIGTPIADAVAAAGGYTEEVTRLIMGGGMTGVALPDDALPITKATNAVIAATASEVRATGDAVPCIRCGECSRVCPAFLMPQMLWVAANAGDMEELDRLRLVDCIECGCCDVVCPSHIELTQTFRTAKRARHGHTEAVRRAARAEARHTAREARLAREAEAREAELEARRAAVRDTEDPAAAIRAILERAGGGRHPTDRDDDG